MHLDDDRLHLSPSDVTAFLACEHLTTLSLAYAHGAIERPEVENEQAELIFRKGLEHERAYLDSLRAEGLTVLEIADPDGDFARGARETAAAILAGEADVIYQAVFIRERWRGVADFLVKQPDGRYEALDTKLARSAKPAYILQLLFYDDEVGRIQGRAPERIHVLLGSGERASFRPREFGAYYRRLRSRLEAFVADPPATEPYPVSHCRICDFKPRCEGYWDAVDHLSRVAGIRRSQIEKLGAAGIGSLAQFGLAPDEPMPQGLDADVWERLHDQAELQHRRRETGDIGLILLKPQPEAGFALLPDPSPGDLFFDFEGNPFWDSSGGLEYLWGILDVDGEFTPLHAHDHATERIAFETFVDLVHERLAEYPDLHVYHYAQYEIAALRRLMGRYGTREAELDDLLRRNVFVDLYKVVRNGIRAAVPGYGLKELEVFLDFRRQAEVQDGGTSIIVFEQWMQTGEQALLDRIDEYNREDCIATRLLRDWLLGLRDESLAAHGPFPLPEPKESKPVPEAKAERAALRAELLAAGHELAAQLLDYHDRERKPVWWAFFDRIEKTPEELLEDADSISGLENVAERVRVDRSWAYTLSFPAQEHKLGQGRQTFDPKTRRSPGEILELDREARRLVLKRGGSFDDVDLPAALIPGRPYDTDDQEDALERLGRSLLVGGGRYPALESVLRREPFGWPVQTTDLDEMKELVRSLDGRHLVIQGPPGSGKTWTSGRLIADLIAAGKTVGVASTSHKAIHNLLAAVEEAAAELGLVFRGLKKASSGNPESYYDGPSVENVTSGEECVDCDLAAGTAWLFSNERHDATLDYLFVDEAGQVSLADALALGTAARNLVLVGDPLQLDQVLQGMHPSGSDASVLKHLLGEHATVPADRGLFLELTFRLHPDVCGYISEEFYEGRLEPADIARGRSTPVGTGLRYLAVPHEGQRQESPEEVAVVRVEVERLRAAGVLASEIMVVAPYNAQVNALKAALPELVRVGTVDKFQGQEATVVLYSLASSSGEEVPRGLEFLLSRNRLNVAISRARCLAYLVCSPRLLEVNARTIEQMRLANALCRFVELAESSATVA
ncbi:MAG: TM0106 family RecB-like putative nuclease [Gaiellaceae bacterium MAG52_C11]|nr:TM0106 family RecB-like putative nuclease [Candidatus Gaiellasilicea maunaloa]